MKSDPYDDFKDWGDGPPPDRPPGRPGRPYGVHATPPGLVRDPSVPMEEAACAPAVRPSRAPPAVAADATPARQGPPTESPPSPSDSTGPAAAPVAPLRPRQERFCQLFAVTGNASEAAWQAGYKFAASRNQGYRLLRRPEIQARVAELQRDLARAIRFDADVMLGKLEGIYRQAVQGGYYNAAARIVEVQARVAGHLRRQAAPANDGK